MVKVMLQLADVAMKQTYDAFHNVNNSKKNALNSANYTLSVLVYQEFEIFYSENTLMLYSTFLGISK